MELPTLNVSNYVSNTAPLSAYATFGSLGSMSPTTTSISKPLPPKLEKKKEPMTDQLRVVKVFIADTNENIPVDKRLLYVGKEGITELTDQELFFEIDIKKLIDTHNAYRTTVKDKDESTKDNVVYLEPVRIRDLKMTVVNVATF